MNLARFGNDFDTAYLLPQLKAQNSFPVVRTSATAQAAGADGEYDFDGDFPAPLSKQVITHQAELEAGTFPAIEEMLDALKQATINQGRIKLWAVLRDGLTYRWAWAKCVGLTFAEAAAQNFLTLPVTLTFELSEATWYSEAQSYLPGGIDGIYWSFNLHNSGRRACPLDVRGNFTVLGLSNVTIWMRNLTNQMEWFLSMPSLSQTIQALRVNASEWRCDYQYQVGPNWVSVNLYSYFSYGAVVPQRMWMSLEPGLNSMQIQVSSYPSGTWSPEFYWTPEYL